MVDVQHILYQFLHASGIDPSQALHGREELCEGKARTGGGPRGAGLVSKSAHEAPQTQFRPHTTGKRTPEAAGCGAPPPLQQMMAPCCAAALTCSARRSPRTDRSSASSSLPLSSPSLRRMAAAAWAALTAIRRLRACGQCRAQCSSGARWSGWGSLHGQRRRPWHAAQQCVPPAGRTANSAVRATQAHRTDCK